jgi:hypothetical protein
MGLLTLTGDRYQVTIPAQPPDIDRVRAAALKLANTEDDDSMAHPEHFISGMSRFEAKQWQRRLNVMNENHRCADRTVLLGIDGTSPAD